jgi:nucleoside-diphosphate kinase
MKIERTLLIVKPDGVVRGLVGEVLVRVERKGYRVEKIKSMKMDRDFAERHYAEHKGELYYSDLIEYITEGPVVVAIISGENSIENVRRILGQTDPLKARPGSIRGAYATSVTRNLVHGSDSTESAAHEIALFFPEMAD